MTRVRFGAIGAAAMMCMAMGSGMATAESAAPTGSADLGSAAAVEELFPALGWANDPECVPSPEHPQPVLLIHGTWSVAEDMEALATPLVDAGYCVYSLEYGRHRESIGGNVPGSNGDGDVHESAVAVDPRSASWRGRPTRAGPPGRSTWSGIPRRRC